MKFMKLVRDEKNDSSFCSVAELRLYKAQCDSVVYPDPEICKLVSQSRDSFFQPKTKEVAVEAKKEASNDFNPWAGL